MPIVNHDTKDINYLEKLIIHSDGKPLQGEIDMYRRIFNDCEKSDLKWHFWHDLKLSLSNNNQSEIQIDFLLVCKFGVVVIEVKGGGVEIINGNYYYLNGGKETLMNRSPFDQADNYKWTLINHKIFNKDQIYIETIVALPHSSLRLTNPDKNLDLSWKLWNNLLHSNHNYSFAEFCIKVIMKGQEKKSTLSLPPLNKNELELVINKLTPTFKEKNVYTEANLQSILDWLKIDNINTLESLSPNNRIVIQGGPGTGKTTIAKAYIKKYSTFKGLYLCWNKMLAKKIEYELNCANLANCEVFQYQSFMLKKQIGNSFLYKDFSTTSNSQLHKNVNNVLKSIKASHKYECYDYIVIDEAQDILDKGIDLVLNELISIRGRGLEDGRFLVFYDTEQGYNSEGRNITEYADYISLYAANFILNENKRVPTNKEIVNYANQILALSKLDSITDIINKINSQLNIAVKATRFNTTKDLIKYLRIILNQIKIGDINGDDYVLLGHSCLQYEQSDNGELIFERISDLDAIVELNETTINDSDNRKLPFTTILRYKGLESKNVILIIKNENYVDKYEIYIGMTRAIMSLHILIL